MRTIDEPYSLRWFINKYYKRVQNVVKGRAWHYHIEFDDLMSIVNEKLGKLCADNQSKFDFRNDVERFIDWLYPTINNAYIDSTRSNSKKFDRSHDRGEFALNYADLNTKNHIHQPNFEIIDFTEELKNFVNKALSYKPPYHKVIFDSIVYNQKTYEETARITSKSLGTVKAIIFRIKDLIKQEFGQKYNHLIKEN